MFKLKYLLIITLILLAISRNFQEKRDIYTVIVKGDVSDLSYAYFIDMDYTREEIKIRHNANISGNVLYSYEISENSKWVRIILIFKNDKTNCIDVDFNKRRFEIIELYNRPKDVKNTL